MLSEKGKPLKVNSMMIKNKKLAEILRALIHARENQKKLRVLQDILFILNGLLVQVFVLLLVDR